MRRIALLVLALQGGLGGVVGAPRGNLRRHAQLINGTAEIGPDLGFLSLPQFDQDPAARAQRLSYKSRYWDFIPYSQSEAGDSTSKLTMAAPGGTLGTAQLQSEKAAVGGQISVSQQEGERRVGGPMAAKCKQISAGGNCFRGLDSYVPLYEAIEPLYRPAAYQFYDSDLAFARERITSSPAFLKRVTALAEVPFTELDVTGYLTITDGVLLAEFLAEKRLFMVDFMPLQRQGLLKAAPNAYLEVPTAVFFLGGPAWDTLLPLAIKFNVHNQHVFSPKDTHADWFLAKAAFNALDRDVNAIYHFALHTAISNIAIAANKYLAQEHPLFHPIAMTAHENFGVIFNGVEALLEPVTGLFSALLSLDGPSIKEKLFPHFMRTFDWEQTYLWTDLTSRGVNDIPGFLYRDDASEIYDALQEYVKQYLEPFYRTPGDVQGDTELAAFLGPLSNAANAYTPKNVAYLKGFPSAAGMRTPDDVARMLTQILWIAGVQHHALNSYRIFNYDLVYPSHPGKILSKPPRAKGQLTDQKLMEQYIAGRSIISHLQQIPVPGAAHTWMGNMTVPGPAAALPLLTGPNVAATSLDFFAATQILAFNFHPLVQETDRLTNAYTLDARAPGSMQAGATLRQRLLGLSQRIQEREAATTDVPVYKLLEPIELPFYLYI